MATYAMQLTQTRSQKWTSKEEVSRCLSMKSVSDRCKYLRQVLSSSSDSDLNDFLPKIICEVFNPSSDWKLRSHRLSRSEEQSLQGFLNPTGPLMLNVLKLESSFSACWRISQLKLSNPQLISVFELSDNCEFGPENWDVPNYSDVSELKRLEQELTVSPLGFYLTAMFAYLVHPLNKKNDFWSDPNHWFLKLFNSFCDFFLPAVVESNHLGHETVMGISKLLSHATAGSNNPNYFYKLRYSESELSLLITKKFTSYLTAFLLGESKKKYCPADLPSLDHVRVIRVLIRHIHSCVLENPRSSPANRSLVFGSPNQLQANCHRLYEEFYSSLMNYDVLPVRLYQFLCMAIRNWPNDFPFRVIVECWLTYIQPWRLSLSTSNPETQDISLWLSFVDDNINFYTQVLQLILPHLLRSDPAMSQNSAVFFRIGKVFAHNRCELMSIVGECEKKLMDVQGMNKSVLSSYCPLLTNENEREICSLIENCLSAIHSLKSKPDDDENSPDSSFWTSMWSPSSKDKNVFDHSLRQPRYLGSDYSDRMSVVRQLEDSVRSWADMFDLDLRGLNSSFKKAKTSHSVNSASGEYPEHTMGELGPELTTMGRWQIMSGKRKFDLTFAGDPDLQPVRSFEVGCLVKASLLLSNRINKRWSEEIESVHRRNDLLSRAVKFCLISEPLRFSPNKMAPIRALDSKTNEFSFRPHVSLRFLASYSALFYLSLLLVVCYLLLPKWVVFVFAFLVLAVPLYFLNK